jgi:ABC-type lipoprotein release transport system permease subunit
MQKNFLYLATRYLFTKHHDATIKFMIKICFAGILVATCCLALVISIMNGFEQATYQKMQSIYPDLIIEMQGQDFHPDQFKNFLSLNPDLHIAHVAAQKSDQALLINPNNIDSPSMVILRGIDPENEGFVSNIESKITNPHQEKLSNLIIDNQILIGCNLAKQLELELGDQVFILCCKDFSTSSFLKFKHTQAIVAGIFKTGIDDLDTSMSLCHHNFFDTIFKDHSVDQVHLRLKTLKHEQRCINKLQNSLHVDVYGWKDLFPTLLSALKLEKYAMIFILFLIVFVASMNIMSLISMYITQKKRDIAIFLCFGMFAQDIKKIFITISILIATMASMAGLSLAFLIGKILQNYPCIKLPDSVYDTDVLPVALDLSVFSVIFIVTILISIMASVFATHHVSKIKIVQILKTL